MTTLRNPVASVAKYSLGLADKSLRYYTKQLATGYKGPRETTSYIIGGKLISSAEVLKSVANAGQYGVSLLDIATSELTSIKDSLTELRTLIAQASPLSATTIGTLNTVYRNKVDSIIAKLSNSNFDGRFLFNGSIANRIVANSNTPVNAAPINLRAGDASNNTISISIPRLLSGNETVADVAAAGAFTPLFPITAAQVANITAIVAAFNLLADKVNNPGGNGASGTAAKAAIAALADPANVFRKFIVDAGKAAAAAATPNAAADDSADANRILNLALNAALEAAKPYISTSAFNGVSTIINAGGAIATGATETDYNNIILAIPASTDPVTNAIIEAAKTEAANGAGANASGFIDRKNDVFKAVIAGQLITINAAGNLFTGQSRNDADAIVSNAIDTINLTIASISGQTSIVDETLDDLADLAVSYEEAGNEYLLTKIEDASVETRSNLIRILGIINILKQGFDIAEATLTLINKN